MAFKKTEIATESAAEPAEDGLSRGQASMDVLRTYLQELERAGVLMAHDPSSVCPDPIRQGLEVELRSHIGMLNIRKQ